MFGIDGFFFVFAWTVSGVSTNECCLFKVFTLTVLPLRKNPLLFSKDVTPGIFCLLIFKKEIFFSKLSTKFQFILSRNFFLLCIIDCLSFCSLLFLSDLFSDFLFLIISRVFLDSPFHVSVYLGNHTTPFTLHKYFFVPKTWEG